MSLTGRQLARLGVLLDEALPLSLPERRTWLESLPEADRPLVHTLRDALLAEDPAMIASGRIERPGFEAASAFPTHQPGEQLGVYQLLRLLGSGGMAEVWLARRADGAFEREVALKIPHLANPSSETAGRFSRECRILASLECPGIARLYDAGVTPDGVPYIAMEYVRGQHLTAWCDARKLGIQERIRLFLQVLDAVGQAHAQQVMHRDLKPSNILVDERGTVRLLDFGVARLLQPDTGNSSLTHDYGRPLTPSYASPEMLRGEAVDPRSDLYSLGVVLHELLTAHRPDSAHTSTLRGRLGEVVSVALNPSPGSRYANAAQFATALRPFASVAPTSGLHVAGLVAAGLLVIALAAGAVVSYRHHAAAAAQTAVTAPVEPVSIAVLPFVNMSGDPRQEYFADGLTEEIINQLAHVRGLQVTARTSAFAFKGKNEDLRSIARQLGVTRLLEGSVRRKDNQLRITAQLINAADGYHLWSQTYERNTSDVLAIQDEIAGKVAANLGPELGVVPRHGDFGGTTSFAAYDHLLRGNVEFAKGTLAGEKAAAEQYRQALAIDPGFARASAELVIALGPILVEENSRAAEIEPEREAAVRHAMAAAPDAPLSLIAAMWVHSDHHEWLEADAATMRALAAGTDPRAEWIGGGFLAVTGRVRAALPYREAARRTDPLAISVAYTVAREYAALGMGDELAREHARITALTGNGTAADEPMLAYLMAQKAPPGQIAERFEHACPYPPQTCMTYARIVRSPNEAASLLRAQLEAVRKQDAFNALPLAFVAAYLGEKEIALDAVEVIGHSVGTPILQGLWYPVLGEVRREPRFKRIVRDIGFVDLWRETGRWADACRPVGNNDFECH